jgi:hypothetical protein
MDVEYGKAYCPNENCPDFMMTEGGNIGYRGKYGKDHDKILLYCKTSGKRFASTQDTPLFGAHLLPEQVHQIIRHTAECESVRATARLLGMRRTR